jgi:ribose transport system substrate-binding protein
MSATTMLEKILGRRNVLRGAAGAVMLPALLEMTGRTVGAQDATPAATPALDCATVEPVNVAFFGFAAANGFAQATWAGVQEAAAEMCATARFFDPNFDSATQVAQIQDAITSGEFQAFVIQSNDGNSVAPVVEEAVAEGIVVVGEFTPIGTDYDSIEPQVEGMTSYVGVSIVANGEGLAELGRMACEDAGADPCRAVYLQGFRALPLDNARTEAVLAGLEAAGIEVVASPEGGYTQATGLAAAQDVLQANPDINVMIGSSQAILGAEQAVRDAGLEGQVRLIGNGAPRQAVAAVKEGRWFAVWADAEKSAGKEAASVAIRAVRGEEVPSSVDTSTLLPTPLGTAENLPEDFEGEWDA